MRSSAGDSGSGRARGRVVISILAAAAGISVAIDYPPVGPVLMPPARRVVTRCSRPSNLDEAHQVLAQFVEPDLLRELKAGAAHGTTGVSDGVARELRNIWGLWNGSRLRTHLLSLGLRHPEEMSELVLVTFGRYLADEPLRVAEEVRRLRAGALRPTPRCPPCIHSGVCTTERVIEARFGRDRGFLVTDCCCGLRPQVLEAAVKRLPNGETVVYPSIASFLYDASCRDIFGSGS